MSSAGCRTIMDQNSSADHLSQAEGDTVSFEGSDPAAPMLHEKGLTQLSFCCMHQPQVCVGLAETAHKICSQPPSSIRGMFSEHFTVSAEPGGAIRASPLKSTPERNDSIG